MDIDILRKAVDILNELIDEKIGSKKKVDPLDEWRALEPGRRLIYAEGDPIRVLEVRGRSNHNHLMICDLLYPEIPSGGPWFAHDLSRHQIIPIGPFDGSKLRVGDWVWVEEDCGVYGNINEGWHQICAINQTPKDPSEGPCICVHGSGYKDKFWYDYNGHALPTFSNRMHYYPPSLDVKETEEQRLERVYDELAKDKAFVAHAIKVVSGELVGDLTCPNIRKKYVDWCHVDLNGYPDHKTPCYKLYGNIQHCPCVSIGQDKVKSDLIKIISKATGV